MFIYGIREFLFDFFRFDKFSKELRASFDELLKKDFRQSIDVVCLLIFSSFLCVLTTCYLKQKENIFSAKCDFVFLDLMSIFHVKQVARHNSIRLSFFHEAKLKKEQKKKNICARFVFADGKVFLFLKFASFVYNL